MAEITKTSSDLAEWLYLVCLYHDPVGVEKRHNGDYVASVYTQPGKPHRVGVFDARKGSGWYTVESEVLAAQCCIVEHDNAD